MKSILKFVFVIILVVLSCKTNKEALVQNPLDSDFTIAFGSCNKQFVKNELWDDILKQNPNLWIWGGDNIYADTDDMSVLKAEYNKQLNITEYKKLTETTKVLGTWDDHDYGLNDGGEEFKMKRESQKQFLDFMGVSQNDQRRSREGVYHAEDIKTKKGTVKIIVLDTRYFRSALVEDNESRKRYKPTTDKSSTILGEVQWQWFTEQLNSSTADFNIIVGSIQFLSMEHGFETWGNFPHEVERLKTTISKSNAKGILLLSGDRHISEFSKVKVDGLGYPLIDFTSSGLTHSYSNFTNEPNKNRVGEVVSIKSYGVLKFNFKDQKITMQMFADGNQKLRELIQQY